MELAGRQESPDFQGFPSTGATGLEPATSGVTGRRSNQLSYAPESALGRAGVGPDGKS